MPSTPNTLLQCYHLWFAASIIIAVLVAASLVAFLLFRLIKSQAEQIPGKRDIIKLVYFVFGIVCVFAIMAIVVLLAIRKHAMDGTNEVVAAGAGVLGLALSDCPLLSLFVVLFASGLLGGAAGHFMPQAKEDSVPWYASCLTGVVAAFITPLLLSMISSNLLTEWQSKPQLLFVIAGLALLAAVFSRRFLTSVYDKFMQQVGQLKTRIEGVEEANEPPPPELEGGSRASKERLTEENLIEDHFRIMEAMTNTKYQSRSLSGLRRGTGLSAAVVNQRLTDLMERGFVSQRQTAENEPRWFLTGPGRKTLSKVKT